MSDLPLGTTGLLLGGASLLLIAVVIWRWRNRDAATESNASATTAPTSSSEQLAPHPRDRLAHEPEPDPPPLQPRDIRDGADGVEAWSSADERDFLPKRVGPREDVPSQVPYARLPVAESLVHRPGREVPGSHMAPRRGGRIWRFHEQA